MKRLAWGAHVSAEFRRIVADVALEIGIDPSWLMACMMFESGLDPSRVNAASGATGLVQFMPSTAMSLGTNVRVLAQMSAEAQLDQYVRQYFAPYHGKLATFNDCYMAILWPKAVGQPDDTILFASGRDAYLLNRGLDLDRDGAVTKAEAAAIPARLLAEGLLAQNAADVEAAGAPIAPVSTITPPEVPSASPSSIPAVELPATTSPENAMNPFIPIILQMIPTLLHIPGLAAAAAQPVPVPATGAVAGGSPHAADYAQLLQTIVDVFTKAVPGAQNTAMAVGMAQSDPKVQAQAAAAVVTHPDVAAQLDALAPTLDKMALYDKEAAAQRIAGRESGVAAALTDPYDVAPVMSKNITQMSWVAVVGMGVVIAIGMFLKAIFPAIPDYAGMLIPAIMLMLGQLLKERGAIVSYRWDGVFTKTQTQKIIDAGLKTTTTKETK